MTRREYRGTDTTSSEYRYRYQCQVSVRLPGLSTLLVLINVCADTMTLRAVVSNVKVEEVWNVTSLGKSRERYGSASKTASTTLKQSLCGGYRPAGWRLRSDLDQNEGHALQILNVLLQEVAGDFQHPGFFLESAGQHLGRVGAVAAVPPRGAGVIGAVPLLQEDTSLEPTAI